MRSARPAASASPRQVLKVNREHYLRKDIWAGYVKTDAELDPPILPGEILIPDTNILLHQVRTLAVVCTSAILATTPCPLRRSPNQQYDHHSGLESGQRHSLPPNHLQ